MSIEFIGFIAHQEASEAVMPQGGLIDPDFIAAYARTQEYGGFDRALIPEVRRQLAHTTALAQEAA